MGAAAAKISAAFETTFFCVQFQWFNINSVIWLGKRTEFFVPVIVLSISELFNLVDKNGGVIQQHN